jgi:hypothetical protein
MPSLRGSFESIDLAANQWRREVSDEAKVVIAFTFLVLAVITTGVVTGAIEKTTAMKAGLHQNEKGHWVK